MTKESLEAFGTGKCRLYLNNVHLLTVDVPQFSVAVTMSVNIVNNNNSVEISWNINSIC